jgi:glycogen(starch) synthase
VRILLWSELYWPYIGGAEIFAANLMSSLRREGIEFLVITSHHDRQLPDEEVHDGITIRRLPFRSAIAGRDAASFVRALKETSAIKRDFAPDLIHMNAIGPSALFHLRTKSSAPLLVTLQQQVLDSQTAGEGTLLGQVIDAADWVVGVSQAVLEQLRAAHPKIAERSSRIYNGVEAPTLAPAPLPERLHVLCLGRLVPAKGFDVAIRAMAHIDARFTIAGDGAARDELMSLANELGVDVNFTGWIEPADVPRLINEASVVVMPSRREGMPVVAIQAALMARPIVATAAGGLPEVVLDDESGILVPAEDPVALAHAIERLADRELATRLGQRGRQHALTELEWSRTVRSYHELYIALSQRGDR